MNTRVNLRKILKHDIHIYSGFKLHLLIFFVAMLTLWIGWFAQGGELDVYAWPVYPTFAWGFILVIHCLVAYRALRARKKTNMRY